MKRSNRPAASERKRKEKISKTTNEQYSLDAPVASTVPTFPTAPFVASAPISSIAPASTRAQASSHPTKGDERKEKIVTNMPGGPMDPSLLKNFESHVAYQIWSNPGVQKVNKFYSNACYNYVY